MSDDKREERLGRAVVGVSWVVYAVVFFLAATGAALALLWAFEGPLWLAPLIGAAAWLIYRLACFLFWKLVFFLTRK